MKLCKRCGKKPARVPDRDTGSKVKAICRDCHADRLKLDMEAVLAARRK